MSGQTWTARRPPPTPVVASAAASATTAVVGGESWTVTPRRRRSQRRRSGPAVRPVAASSRWPRLATALLARTWLYALLWLALWVAVPATVLGWTPVTISSGSMQPGILRGDVLLLEPASGPLDVGRVVTFRTPTGLVSHRVIEVLEDGGYRTKGDANRTADSTPLAVEDVAGAARIVVPKAGLPSRWFVEGRWPPLTALVSLTALALFAARLPVERRRVRGPRGGAGVGVLLAVLLAATVVPAQPAVAWWSSSTGTSGSWSADVLAAPTGVSASHSCGVLGVLASITVDWTASTSTVEGYRVLRSVDGGGLEVMNGGALVTTTSWTDTDVNGGTTYRYVVRSVAGSWTSADTGDNETTITTPSVCLA